MVPGAEPLAVDGGREGALVLHGFTGNPSSMRPVADAFAEAGWSVELPRLPGHGTSVTDMATTGWADWRREVDDAWARLAARTDRRVVIGLSMGATLAVDLAAELAAGAPADAGAGTPGVTANGAPEGLVLINAAAAPMARELVDHVESLVEQGETTMPGIASDIAAEGVVESAYDQVPLMALLSLAIALDELQERLATIGCPVLICTSPQDHVVSPADSEHLAMSVKGPVRTVTLERSFHVATLDHDAPSLIAEALSFAREVTAG